MRRLASVNGRRAPLALILLLLAFVVSGQAQAGTVEQQIAGLPTVQPFNGESTSTTRFAANWTAFAWASEKGQDTTTGWRVVPAYPTESAAFYTTEYTATSGGVAAAVTMPVNPGTLNTGRFLSLWIDTTSEAFNARSGYELRFTVAGATTDTYDVTLSKWQAGSRTLLASQSGVSFVNGNSLALADQGGTVTAWTNRGSGFTQLLSASDATFNQGRVGLGGAGNITRLATYRAGQLSPAAPTLSATSPASPANNNAPFVIGSAAAGTTVKVFANATCTGTPVATGTAAALAAPGIQVAVADNTTTTFYATATDGLGNASDCSRGISYTERSATGTAGVLAELSIVDAFATAENPLSGGGTWTRLAWAGHPGQVSGSGTTGGWGPYNAFPAVHGAYWNQKSFADDGEGAAVAATLSASPSAAERYFSLWLDMPSSAGAQTGYELRFTQTATANTYNVTLSKWQAGARTVLATQPNYAFAAQSSFALVDKGTTVSVWTNTGSGFVQLLAASDATFVRGYVGIEGAGNITRVRDFKADASTSYVNGATIQTSPSTPNTATYTPPSGPSRTVHLDRFTAPDGAEQQLPETEDYVSCATSGHRIKIVYSSAASPAVPSTEKRNQILSIVRRTNSKVIREALRSSGNTRAVGMRVDCDASESIQIYGVTSVSNEWPALMAATKAALGDPVGADAVKYLVFRDALSYDNLAGIAESFQDTDKTSSDSTDGSANESRIRSTVAIAYRGPAGERNWESHTPLHELTHSLGATLPGSPFHTAEGHCNDGIDIMCYEESHGEYRETYCPTGTERGYNTPLGVPLDCNYDSYFDAATEPGEWLESHWNIGGPEDPYLVERPADIPPGGYPTEAFITLDGTRNGAPGTASVHGHILRTNGSPAAGTVNVNFQKLVNGTWETMSTAQRTLDANGYYEVIDWGVGVGRWRVRTVFPKQGYYAESQSSYREFDIQRVPTEAFITLDGTQNGAPGTASVHGHVLRTNGNPAVGTVNVNFQKLVSGVWTTMSTAVRTLDGNGYYEVVNWGVGVGDWRVRAVFPDQGDYLQSESEYKTFSIQPVPTQAFITLDGTQNGTPGTASVHGHVLRTNGNPAVGTV
ncbi:MAG TPA: hypothetical protein VFS37_14730, partial [Conexibacter sp.]|nr:hypothetical protein [Conexibacter sp.]